MTVESAVIDPYLPERGNDGYAAIRYELELDYAVPTNRLDGRARIVLTAVDARSHLAFDLVGLRASRVTVAGRPARWRQQGGKLYVFPAEPIPAGAATTVDIRYGGSPSPIRSAWGPVGWEELTDGVLVAAQPSGACTWFPCNDLARQKAPFRISVTTASAYRVTANGAIGEVRTRGSTTTWTFEQVEPMSPYLAALHVGRYAEHQLAAGPVPINLVVGAAERRRAEAAFSRQGSMMDFFVDRFGPYPFAAGYTIVVCPEPLEMPLEAQGLAVFGTNHLDGQHERLIAHELAHQWFGNSVTAERWRDIWLHEGFACYAEWLWSEHAGGPTAEEQARIHHARVLAMPKDLLLADPGPIDMFDDRVYKRGALTLHALRLELGELAFSALLHEWTARHQHGTATSEDFEALAAEVAGRQLHALFDAWLREAALPPLSPAGPA